MNHSQTFWSLVELRNQGLCARKMTIRNYYPNGEFPSGTTSKVPVG